MNACSRTDVPREEPATDGRVPDLAEADGWREALREEASLRSLGLQSSWLYDTAAGGIGRLATGTGESYESGIQWDAHCRLAEWSTGAGARELREFHATTGRLDEISIEGAAGEPFERVRYGYDPGDRVTNVTDLINSARNRGFGYDARGRLTEVA